MHPFLPPHHDPNALRAELRRRFVQVARNLESGTPCDPSDLHLASVLLDHPQARSLLASATGEALIRGEDRSEREGSALFLHLALHVALREQVAADRPPGIRALHERYVTWAHHDRVEAEHRMLPILAEAMERELSESSPGDPRSYLEALTRELIHLGGSPPSESRP